MAYIGLKWRYMRPKLSYMRSMLKYIKRKLRYPGPPELTATRANQVTASQITVYLFIHGLVLLDPLSVAVLITMSKLHKNVERCWPHACRSFDHRAVLSMLPGGFRIV